MKALESLANTNVIRVARLGRLGGAPIALFVLTLLSFGLVVAGSKYKENSLAGQLGYEVTSVLPRYGLDQAIEVSATLTNKSKKPVAVSDRSLAGYRNYDVLGSDGETIVQSGQSIGDPWPSDAPPPLVILEPRQSLTRKIDLRPLLWNVLDKPGRYRVSLEYCNFEPRRSAGVRAPVGCVTSNAAVILVGQE